RRCRGQERSPPARAAPGCSTGDKMLVELFIPLASNEGETFTADHHAAFEAVLTGLFGGFSRLPGVVTGGWEDAGRIYRDDLVIYAVVLPSLAAGGKVAEAV